MDRSGRIPCFPVCHPPRGTVNGLSVVELSPENKIAGILAPVSALRGKQDLGIGDTESLKELVAWSADHGLGAVQILPIYETGGDSSPYNLLSAVALEPSTIATTPSALPDLGEEDFATITGRFNLPALLAGPVNYRQVKEMKRELLAAAFAAFQDRRPSHKRVKAFAAFQAANASWLDNYSIYRALLAWNGTEVLTDWPAEHRSPAAAAGWIESLDETQAAKFGRLKAFYAYVQWIAFEQWQSVRAFADELSVALIGDVPVGVSIYSCDVWSQPDLFDLVRSSGAPPEKVFKSDPFTEQWGQNWGFPLYHWDRMAQDDYGWWRRRLQSMMSVFHLIRIDHALGFFRIYSFPWRPEDNASYIDLTPEQAKERTGGLLPGFVDQDDSTEENREFNRVHGEKILSIFVEEVGPHRLIAEDLGEVAPYVRPTLQRLEVPGFKIPQWERVVWDRLTPGRDYERLSLATFATHDHPPLKALWTELYANSLAEDAHLRDAAIHSMWEFMEFCGHGDIKLPQDFTPEIHDILVRGLFATNSWLAIHMVTDFFGTDERFNVPGAAGDLNWTQRVSQPVALWDTTWPEAVTSFQSALTATGRSTKS